MSVVLAVAGGVIAGSALAAKRKYVLAGIVAAIAAFAGALIGGYLGLP